MGHRRDSGKDTNEMLIPEPFASSSQDDGQTYVDHNTVELEPEFKTEQNSIDGTISIIDEKKNVNTEITQLDLIPNIGV